MLHAGVAQLVRVLLVDDCGQPVTTGGAAQVNFANASGGSIPAITLQNAGGGFWEGTWVPSNTASNVTLNFTASSAGASNGLLFPASVNVVVAAAASTAAQTSGLVNAATQTSAGVIAPGSIVSLYGTGLLDGAAQQADSAPLPTTLGTTQVFIGGQPLPMFYAGAGQINAVVPQTLNPNTSYQLVVSRGDTGSVPVNVTTAAYQPGIYTLDFSGNGQGAVEIAGTSIVAGPSGPGAQPARRGSDYLSIYATGLGPVTGANGEAAPADGAAAPTTLLYNAKATITATLGGVRAPVVFAGLTPGAVALYQVNVAVPAAVASGDAVPLILTVTDSGTGRQYVSNAVTVALQ